MAQASPCHCATRIHSEAWASEQHFDLETGAQFTGDAWDFRKFK